MNFSEFLKKQMHNTNESKMKYDALAMAKETHTALAEITFIDMLSVMSNDNPAKKEIQALEKELNDLTTKVGAFIQKYIPDVGEEDLEGKDDKVKDKDDEDEDDEDKVKDKDDEDEDKGSKK
jgi:Skp family chaperone for outer membrane proteins